MFQEGKKEMGGNGTAFTHIDFLKILEEKSDALHKLHKQRISHDRGISQ